MSDDIDIEEHDILNNPLIKTIFPDLSILKKEILDFEEVPESETELPHKTSISDEINAITDYPDVRKTEIQEYTGFQFNNNQIVTKLVEESESDLVRLHSNKKVLSKYGNNEKFKNFSTLHADKEKTKEICFKLDQLNQPGNIEHTKTSVVVDDACLKKSWLDFKNRTTVNKMKGKPYVKLHSNKIVLGTKPSPLKNNRKDSFKRCVKLNNLQVLLTDCKPFLHNSNRYCADCLILFSDHTELEAHYKTNHINFNRANNIIKCTRKYNCLNCNIFFSSKEKLKKHEAKLHHIKNNIVAAPEVDSDMPLKSRILKSLPNECFHCTEKFLDQKSLIEHLYYILQLKKINSSKTSNKETLQKKNYDDIVALDSNSNLQDKKVVAACVSKKMKFSSQVKEHQNFTDNTKSKKVKFTLSYKKLETHIIEQKDVKDECTAQKKNISEPLISTNENRENKPINKKVTVDDNFPKSIIRDSNSKKILEPTIAYGHASAKSNKNINKFAKKVYECNYCTYYFNELKYCKMHIKSKHKLTNIPKTNKVSYNPVCKYCSRISRGIDLHNVHLQKYHKDKINGIVGIHINGESEVQSNGIQPDTLTKVSSIERKSDYFSSQKIKESALVHNKEEKDTNIGANISRLRFLIFKSVLFKCSKCDIHFLSLETALSHSEHMEILVNWKCTVCMKIFKQNDEVLHKKQHLSCDLFTVYDTSELNVSLILYKCSKCTVHYDETNYREHYSDCELKTPNASYCIVCDILLDNHVMKSHESEHKLHNLTPTDFTIIDCDILLEEIEIVCNENHPSEKTNIESLKKMQNERFRYIIDKNKLLVKSFCSTCKCFVSNVGWLRKVHIQSRCQHLTKHVCIYCGLLLTSKTLATHKNMHRRKTKISLQDFKFFDLKSGKRIIPPIPEYPKCEICDIHFISKLAIKNHICSDHEFSTCSVCFVKLSRPVLKLHMAFHNYTLKKKIKILSHKSNSNKSVSSEEETRNFEPQNSQISNDDLSQLFKGKKLFFLYRCRTCSITLNTYDKMIHHCHLHYNNLEHEIKTEICNYCQLTFEIGCYESHKLSHSNTFYKRLFKKFEFDIFYFKFDGDIWTKHVFGSLPQEKINEARAESIYQHEHRIKMHIVQDGPFDMTVYKCDSCNCIIEPELIYKHIEIDCLDLRKHVCVFCGLTFLSLLLKRSHENVHKRTGITSKSFRIILFNQNADKVYNSMFSDANNYYILYQCRTCSIVVNKYQTKNHKCSETELKRCSDCGLLFDDNEYESHLIKHKDFDSFIPENMKLVLFGKLIEKDNIPKKVHKKFAPFRGAVYNYTFYKCSNCEVCMKNYKSTLCHVCSHSYSKIKCDKCDLYFHFNWYKAHCHSHVSDPDFERGNMDIISFDPNTSTSLNPSKNNTVNASGTETSQDTLKNVNDSEIIKNDCVDEQLLAKVFKCTSCGLNFLEESSIKIHFTHCGTKNKLPKQNCSKCELLFTPNELFTHLLMHHGHKNKTFKFEIVEKSKTA